MKILHTSDWHIGKRLHGVDFIPDIQLFFEWLVRFISSEHINVLLVSGDIFDMANPSSEARKSYYHFLSQIGQLDCQVIITGGNHDSAPVLNAPKELLKSFGIHVIGGLSPNIEDLVIPIGDKKQPKLVVAAVPYLRDGDLRTLHQGESYKDRKEAIQQGIKKIYQNLAEVCRKKYPKTPAIAMGHLFVQGANSSDSEREIQVGNLAGIQATSIDNYFIYKALGHIHKPQTASKSNQAFYSGSPVALSFSEEYDQKRVLLLELKNGAITHSSIAVPPFRKLIQISGTLEAVKAKLNTIDTGPIDLNTLLNIIVLSENPDPLITASFQQLIAEFNEENDAQVIHQRLIIKNRISGTANLYDVSSQLEDLKPMDVFQKRLDKEDIPDNTKNQLKDAFQQVYEMVLANENVQP